MTVATVNTRELSFPFPSAFLCASNGEKLWQQDRPCEAETKYCISASYINWAWSWWLIGKLLCRVQTHCSPDPMKICFSLEGLHVKKEKKEMKRQRTEPKPSFLSCCKTDSCCYASHIDEKRVAVSWWFFYPLISQSLCSLRRFQAS